MHDIFIIMKFTIKEMLKRKSFIISTLIILLMIVIGCNIPNIINSFKSEDVKTKIVIVDENNVFENKLDNISLGEKYDVVLNNYSIDEIKEKILDSDIEYGIIVDYKDNSLIIKYIVQNAMWDDSDSTLVDVLYKVYQNIQLEKLDLTDEEISALNPVLDFSIEQAEEEANGNILTMMIMSIVLFYAIYFCAYQVSSSITTEKTSKIIETLVTSTSPRNVVLGKTIGIGIVGLCQIIIIVLTTLLSVYFFVSEEIVSAVLDTSTITVSLGLITILYFILGYFTYALLYALTGSTVSKPEDVQSANTPVALITVVGFYLAYFTMLNPSSDLNFIASILPISSPFCMPFRIMMGLAKMQDVILSIVLLVATIIVIAKVTIKIYSNAILNYGTKLSFKDIINMYKQK